MLPSPSSPAERRRDAALVCGWIGLVIAVPSLAIAVILAAGGPASDIVLVVAVPIALFGRTVLLAPFVIVAVLGIAALLVGLSAPRPQHVALVGGGCLAASLIGLVLVAGLHLP